MAERSAFARRVFVISDLHLGGEPPTMMSSSERLTRFIDGLASRLGPNERLELVIAGDFLDFLAVSPFAAWTANAARAREKLVRTLNDPAFRDVFDALGRLVAAGHELTILIGNHDVELVLPAVQEAFLDHLGAGLREVHFVDDGRAYRIGRLLVEHGNRYDPSNENDWNGLRAIASAQSRWEASPVKLRVSAGSTIVERIVSPLKARYPFIDLLQPQGELVALLIAAFEPAMIVDLPKVGRLFRGGQLQGSNPKGLQPGRTWAVAANGPAPIDDPELRAVFGGLYEALRRPSEQVSFGDIITAAWHARNDSLSAILDRGEDIPLPRLRQIQMALRRMLLSDRSDQPDGDTEQYGEAARRLVRDSGGEVEVVIMGHTHQARHIGPAERASYINTGSWVDVIRVPQAALEQGGESALQEFLRSLGRNEGRTASPTYADVRIERDGTITHAQLLWAEDV